MLYNTFYCGVSGSPIDPNRGKVYDYVKLDHVDGNRLWVSIIAVAGRVYVIL